MAEERSSDDIVDYIKCGDIEGVMKCLDLGVYINQQDDDWKETLLGWAAEYERLEILKFLIYKGADIHIPNAAGRTPLFYAALSGQNDAVKILLDNGADVNCRENSGMTPLHAAARSGNEATIVTLIECINTHDGSIDPVDDDGETPLSYAARRGFPEAVRKLCIAGSNVNGADPRGRPLIAASRGGDKTIVEVLLDQGADSNMPDDGRRLPIYWAAKAGNLELFELFWANIAAAEPNNPPGPLMVLFEAIKASEKDDIRGDVHSRDEDGWTALHLAANFGHVNAIEALVKAESDVNALDNGGMSPLLLAARNGKVSSIKTLLNTKAVDLDVKDTGYRRTALSWAAEIGQTEVVQILANAGSDVNSQDEDGLTPLILTSKKGYYDSIKTLLRFRPNLDTRDIVYGQSAVSYAAERGHAEIVELLIEAGCEIYSQAEERYPPLERAVHSFKLLRVFFEPKSNEATLPKRLLRTKAIAEALHHARDNNYWRTMNLILKEDWYLSSADENGRTVLSWVAEVGHGEIVRAILDNGAESDTSDDNGRTPLSWAAGSGNEEIIELLLGKGARPNSSDRNSRTPLSWAAESGNLAVTRKFLSIIATYEPLAQEGESAVDLRAKSPSWTPLWYAALGGHVKVTRALLEYGANPLIEDNGGKNLMHYLAKMETSPLSDGSNFNATGRKNVRRMLDPFFSLLAQSFSGSEAVDGMFSATVLHFPRSHHQEIRHMRKTVQELLTSQVDPGSELGLQWFHLPANNMRWVEILMTRHYEACGDKGSQNRNQILKPKLWRDNQSVPKNEAKNKKQDATHDHERFMRAGCHVLSASMLTSQLALQSEVDQGKEIASSFHNQEKRNKSKIAKTSGGSDPRHKGFVLFMPYLHWECKDEVLKLKRLLEDRSQQQDQKKSREVRAEKVKSEGMKLNGTEKLLWMYLGEDHPLHIRRTLDQYYYANSSNLKGRDEDQTSLRYFRDQDISSEEFDPVLTMVDQLWMWVLPKCGESPPTIITAFPERSNRNVQKPTALMANIVGKCRDLSNWSCYEVAEIIVTECSRIYLDSTSNRNQIVQFLHVYESSIGRIMDSDAERFRTFPENMRKANEVLGLAKRKAPRIQTKFRHLGTSKTEQDRGSKANEALDGEDLQELLDIEDDIEDLRQIKDIRDELLMMNYLFYTQHEVIREMKRIVQGDRSRIESKRASKKFNRLFTSPYPPHAIVEQNLNEVGRLDELAQKAEKSIQYLLELKQKQADLVLTKAIYNINDATDRQGKTLLTFTVVTIIFLPLSFMASFLALDIVQFPWEGDKLPLNWVVKIILSVSLPLSVALLFIAFNLNESQRKKHLRPITKLMSPLMRLAAREQSEPRPSGMRKRNYNPDRDAEEGTNGAFAP